jgi:hypothetical protein
MRPHGERAAECESSAGVPTALASTRMVGARQIPDVIADRLATYLGPHTARVAVKTFSMRALGRGPETLTLADIPDLVKALRPMLRTMVGKVKCEAILAQLERELES